MRSLIRRMHAGRYDDEHAESGNLLRHGSSYYHPMCTLTRSVIKSYVPPQNQQGGGGARGMYANAVLLDFFAA